MAQPVQGRDRQARLDGQLAEEVGEGARLDHAPERAGGDEPAIVEAAAGRELLARLLRTLPA